MKNIINGIKFKLNIKTVIYPILLIGIILTLIYIFYTSTAILTSDSVITDVLAHQQKINKEFILSHWYYGNEFWFFSLSIPTFILSFIIKNSLLLRQICVLMTAIIFFILLYIYGKKYLKKNETLFLIAIFLSGVSYSVLDYFYAFNAYLTVIINSMLLFMLYYKSIEAKESKKIYYILSLIFTFLFSVGSMRYFPSVTVPFILTEFTLLFMANYKKDLAKALKTNKNAKIIGIFIIAVLALGCYSLLTKVYHFETRASSGEMIEVTTNTIIKNTGAVLECVYNFFGFDNRNHPYTFMTGKQYFLPQSKDFSVYSIRGICNVVKILACILFIVIVPITLFKKYKDNDKKINFLLIFNTYSWITMIYLFVMSDSFFHHYSELKYFLFNIIINIILGLYCIYKYYTKNKNVKLLFDIFLILYIVSNIYTTSVTIFEHDKKVMKQKYELVETLKENDLTFGYGGFWSGLLTYYLSDYEIEVASVDFYREIVPYRWYSDERWYEEDYHKGRTFLIMDEQVIEEYDYYVHEYGEPDDELVCEGFTILVYDNNPFADRF